MVEDLRDKSKFLGRTVLQTKLLSLPKMQARGTSFAALVDGIAGQLHSLRIEAAALERAALDLRLNKMASSAPRKRSGDILQFLHGFFRNHIHSLHTEAAGIRVAVLNSRHRGKIIPERLPDIEPAKANAVLENRQVSQAPMP